MAPTVLSLFSGYGGLDLGLHAALGGGRTLGYVEREAYPAAVLLARMEEQTLEPAPVWCGDIADLDTAPFADRVDWITGGFPCQPFSSAGKRRGQDDERWLWDDIVGVLRTVRPRVGCVFENVPGLVRLGLGPVLRDLAVLGFDVEWGRFSAEGVGASHRRERIFILARRRDGVDDSGSRRHRDAHEEVRAGRDSVVDAGGQLADAQSKRRPGHGASGLRPRSNDDGRGAQLADAERERRRQGESGHEAGQRHDGCAEVADAQGDHRRTGEREKEAGARSDGERRRRSAGGKPDVADPRRELLEGGHDGRDEGHGTGRAVGRPLFAPGPSALDLWARVLTETPEVEPSLCGVADGTSTWLDDRTDRLRALGNGVVPLQAATAIRVLAARAGWRLT